MNGEEKRTLYLEFIYPLRMDVYRIVKSVIGDADMTEEVTQIVLEKAWRSIGTLREKSKAKEWIKAITRNALRDHFRREKREAGSCASEDPSTSITIKMADYLEPDPLSIALEREAQRQALEAVGCLAERDQEVIWKHLIQEIQLKDIAREKGIQPTNMRRIYALSLRNLKRVYREKFGWEDMPRDT